jgi:hypothetical protein
MHRRAAIIIVLFSSLHCSSSYAAGVQLGPLCIEGARLVENEAEKTFESDGYWSPINLTYRKTGKGVAKAARIDLFDKPLPKFARLLSCKEVISEAKRRGVNLLFSGRLDKLDLTADLFSATAHNDNRLQIRPNNFNAHIGSTTDGTLAVNGGTVNLKGDKLRIFNPTLFVGSATTLAGIFELSLRHRQISNMRLVSPGGATLRATFIPVNSIFDVQINMATRQVDLWAGLLHGSPTTAMVGHAANIGGLALSNPNIAIHAIDLFANNGRIAVRLDRTNGKADEIIWKQRSIVTELKRPSFEWATVAGTARSAPGQLNLTLPAVSDGVFSSPFAILGSDAGAEVVAGAFTANFPSLSENHVAGTLKWSSPETPSLQFLMPPGSVTSVDLHVQGPPESPRIDGNFDVNQISLAGMLLKQRLSLSFTNVSFDDGIRIPIKFDVRDRSGQFALIGRDQKVLITAGLRRAFLDSTLVINLPDWQTSHLEVPPNGFQLALFSELASELLIAGTTPTFGDLDLGAVNPTVLYIGATSTGWINLDARTLIIDEPIIRIGHKGTESRAKLKMQSDGGAMFRYECATGILSLAKADLELKNVDFKLLDRGGVVDISGIEITDPEVQLEYLKIVYDQVAAVKVGTASGRRFRVSGSRIEKQVDPLMPTEITYSASLARPLNIKEFHAFDVEIAKVLSLQLIDVKQVDVAMVGGNAAFGDGFRIKSASISLSVDELATLNVNETLVENFNNARFGASGSLDTGNALHLNNDPSFQVRLNVSGFGAALKGDGEVTIGAFSGSKVADVEFHFPCAHGEKAIASMEYNFQVPATSAAVAVNGGDFFANARIGPLKLVLHSTTGAQCNGEQGTITLPPVIILGPRYPCIRDGHLTICHDDIIIEPKAKYHLSYKVAFTGGFIVLTDALLALSNRVPKVCNASKIDSHLLFVPDVSPQIDQIDVAGVGLDEKVRKLANIALDADFMQHETILATSILNGAGLLADSLISVMGIIGCF